jgi:hypothetical protein
MLELPGAIMRRRGPVAERTYKSIVFEVLPDAIEQERSPSGLIDSRGLFYAVRRLYNAHPERPFEKERKKAEKGQGEPLDYGYFNGEMLHHFEARYGEIEGLTREPRGHLFEAHTNGPRLGKERERRAATPYWTLALLSAPPRCPKPSSGPLPATGA